LFASCSLVVAGLLGCDSETDRANKEIDKAVQGTATEHGDAAISALSKVASQAKASAIASANAKVALAHAEADQARVLLRDVARDELGISRLLSEMGEIAEQVKRSNTLVASYETLSKQAIAGVSKDIAAQQAAVQGKAAEDTWKLDGDAGELPALSNANARAEKLAPQIQELETKKADLLKQKTAADAKASDLLKQSKRKSGKESLNLFTQSAQQSKAAADTATEIAKVDHELMKLQQDLELAKAQSAQLDATSKEFAARIEENQKSQAELDALVEAHRALAKALVYGDGSQPAPSSKPGDKGDTATPPAEKTAPEGADAAKPAAFQEKAPAEGAPADAAAPADTAPAETAPAEAAPADAAPAPTPTPAQPTDAAPTEDVVAQAEAAKQPPSPLVINTTIAAKAKEMAELVKDADGKRKQAADLLTSSLSHYDGAISDAGRLRSELQKDINDPNARTLPQAEAWKSLSESLNPGGLNLQKANVQQMLAALHRDAAASLAARSRMLSVIGPTLEEGKIDVPAELMQPDIEKQLAAEQTAATEAYAATDALLKDEVVDKVTGSSPTDTIIRNGGTVAQVIALFGQAQLHRAVGNDAEAQKLADAARSTVQNGTVPAEEFPAYVRHALGIHVAAPTTVPTAPTPTPGAEPTTAPTTEPTSEPAPSTEPAPATAPAGQ
jgi:hypothetical protein